jgi:hypothetical protein
MCMKLTSESLRDEKYNRNVRESFDSSKLSGFIHDKQKEVSLTCRDDNSPKHNEETHFFPVNK